jgi:hypothetical protein
MDALKKDNELLANIKSRLPELAALLQEMNSPWFYEDLIYRFYHQSFKVYALQNETKKIADVLKSLAPNGATFCKEFEEIYSAGASGKQFEMAHNQNWTAHTRVFAEAFFHAKFFLEMAVKYGSELDTAPALLPSGWAALLCLYKMR